MADQKPQRRIFRINHDWCKKVNLYLFPHIICGTLLVCKRCENQLALVYNTKCEMRFDQNL